MIQATLSSGPLLSRQCGIEVQGFQNMRKRRGRAAVMGGDVSELLLEVIAFGAEVVRQHRHCGHWRVRFLTFFGEWVRGGVEEVEY